MNTKSISIGTAKYSFSLGNNLTIEFFLKVNNQINSNYTLFNTGNTSSFTQYAEIVISPALKIGVRTGGNCYGGIGDLMFSNKSLELGKCYHIAITMNSSTYIYIDGELASSDLYEATSCGKQFHGISLGRNSINIGAPTTELVQLEFPRIWNRILTTDEIIESAHRKNKLLDDQTDLVFYDTFVDGQFINRVDNTLGTVYSGDYSLTPIFKNSILIEVKMLIRKNGKYYTYENGSLVESVATQKEDIKTYGMSTLNDIPKDILNNFLPFDIDFYADTSGVNFEGLVGRTATLYNSESKRYEGSGELVIPLTELPEDATKCEVYLKGYDYFCKTALYNALYYTTNLYTSDNVRYGNGFLEIDMKSEPLTTTHKHTKENPFTLIISMSSDSYLEAISYSWY